MGKSELQSRGPILPPFNFNAPDVACYPAEVTGRMLLQSMCERLGWASLARKRILDFGCGVRFARTIFNLDVPVARYFGIDVNAEAISWLKANLPGGPFGFAHIDMRNALYNKGGADADPDLTALL